MARLRNPAGGCPWDLEQDFATIAPYTIEEAYEVADCIEREAYDELAGELGDLLLQVVFHSQMAAERGWFEFGDVAAAICDKMIRRHPHVFGDQAAATGAEVARNWEDIKQREKPADQRLLADVALALPALLRAAKLGRRAAAVGFDWPTAAGVRRKIAEELAELDAAVAANHAVEIEAEVGDLLFAVANYCRHLQVDPEHALRRANDRFRRRFAYVEDRVREQGGNWQAFGLAALDEFWNQAKAAERHRNVQA